MTRMLPNIEAAMIADITRLATSPPKTAPKKTVAISKLQRPSIKVWFANALSINAVSNLLTESLTDKHWIDSVGS